MSHTLNDIALISLSTWIINCIRFNFRDVINRPCHTFLFNQVWKSDFVLTKTETIANQFNLQVSFNDPVAFAIYIVRLWLCFDFHWRYCSEYLCIVCVQIQYKHCKFRSRGQKGTKLGRPVAQRCLTTGMTTYLDIFYFDIVLLWVISYNLFWTRWSLSNVGWHLYKNAGIQYIVHPSLPFY